MEPDAALETYFRGYAAAATGADPTAPASFYAEQFIAAGPRGSAVFGNDEGFLDWLKQVHRFNRETGMEGLEVVSVRRAALGEAYTLATVEWGARFHKTGDELIRFEISYLLHAAEGPNRILAFVSHEDQEEAMRARGLL